MSVFQSLRFFLRKRPPIAGVPDIETQTGMPISAEDALLVEKYRFANKHMSDAYALAVSLQHQRRFEEAASAFELAADLAQPIYGTESPQFLEITDGRVRLLLLKGEKSAALAMASDAQKSRKSCFGAESTEYAEGLDALALAYKSMGQIDVAEDLQRQAVALFDAIPGRQDWHGRAIGNLVGTLIQKGATREALPLLVRALQTKECILGPMHPSLAHTLSNIAVLAATAEAYYLAEPIAERAHAILQASFGPSHPDTIKAKDLLSQIKNDVRQKAATRSLEDNVRSMEKDFLSTRQSI
ncbi:tetratricopeptide repeat protein [Pseudoduganella lutea]|nr:tetratricopeptide repeat protein [Pseudoduganella lutea]